MSPRRNIPFLNSRWTAVWLVLLQFGVIALGHPLHSWMHESAHSVARASHASHGSCGGCVAEPVSESGVAAQSSCCASADEQANNDNLKSGVDATEREVGLNSPAPHRCWSWDCAFFRGMHQPLTLTQSPPLVGLDLPSFEFACLSNLTAQIGEHFSLRARGPPHA
jgi:hypothetical protein